MIEVHYFYKKKESQEEWFKGSTVFYNVRKAIRFIWFLKNHPEKYHFQGEITGDNEYEINYVLRRI